MKKISLMLGIFIFLIACLGCFGCNTQQTLKTKVRVNEVTHSVFYAPLYVAMENGYFDEENIQIELTNGGGADKSMSAVLSGAADIGLMGPEAAMYVYLNGKQNYPKIFGQLTKRDGSFLISRTPATNFSYNNLTNTEIIAGRKGGVPAMTLAYLLNQKGYTDNVNIKLNYDIQFNLTAAAFESGTGDYCTLFEPTASEFEKAGKGYIVASVGQDSGEVPYTAFMALSSYIENNEQIIKSFLKCIYKALEFVKNADDIKLVQSLKKHFPSTDDEIILSSINRYVECDAWVSDMTMTKESFERLKSIMRFSNELQNDVPYDKIILTTYSNIK